MTSRVQKGGPIFRPVTKTRLRQSGSTRQFSVAGDGFGAASAPSASSTEQDISDTSSLSSMPPPPTIPVHSSSYSQNNQELTDAPSFTSSQGTMVSPSFPPTHPPTLASSSPVAPSPTFRQPRTPVPPLLVSSGTSKQPLGPPPVLPEAPLHTPSPPPPHLLANPPPSRIERERFTTVASTPLNTSHHCGAGNMPEMDPGISLDLDAVVDNDPESNADAQNGKRLRKRAKNATTGGEVAEKRKRNAKTLNADAGEEVDASSKKRGKRSPSETPRPRRSRAPSLPPFDPDADPGEELDPTVVTMASLCNDTGQGRVSSKAAEILSNHAAWKAQSKEKRARMRALMESKKYGREEEAEESDQNPNPAGEITPIMPAPAASRGTLVPDETSTGFDYSQDLQTSRFNVQVRIGPNGETIIDEESLVVDRVETEDTTTYTHVTESDNTKFVNSGSYGKRYRGSRWSAEETERFYDALSQYGENYELIAYMLPGRDRKSCKNKFKIEDKRNHARINYCLNNSIPVDIKALSQMTGKDFSGPVPEIRTPTPLPTIEVVPMDADADSTQVAIRKRSRSRTAAGRDDALIVVGDADGFEI